MRVVIVGGSPLGVLAAKGLCERGHEVVLIDENPEKVEQLAEELDCGLVTGDGSRPALLSEVGADADFLFCVSDRDQANVLGALVGRSLGFRRVVPKVEDPDLETICTELGLEDVIVPDREVGLRLVDLVEGRESPELTSVVRSGLRFFGFELTADHLEDDGGLDLPDRARLIALTRGDESVLADMETPLEPGDAVVLLVHEDELNGLKERFTEAPEPDSDD